MGDMLPCITVDADAARWHGKVVDLVELFAEELPLLEILAVFFADRRGVAFSHAFRRVGVKFFYGDAFAASLLLCATMF